MIPELDEIGAIDVDFTPPKPRANKKRIQPRAVSINTTTGESEEVNDTQPLIVTPTPVNPESDTKIVSGPYKEHKRFEEHDSFYVQGEGWISRNEDEIADAKESIAN